MPLAVIVWRDTFQVSPGGISGCFVSSDVTIQHMLLIGCNPAKKVEGNQSKRNGLSFFIIYSCNFKFTN